MATDSVRNLVGKAISDEAFRKQLLAEPAKTAKAHGFQLTDAEMEALRKLKEDDFKGLTLEELDERLSKEADGCGGGILH